VFPNEFLTLLQSSSSRSPPVQLKRTEVMLLEFVSKFENIVDEKIVKTRTGAKRLSVVGEAKGEDKLQTNKKMKKNSLIPPPTPPSSAFLLDSEEDEPQKNSSAASSEKEDEEEKEEKKEEESSSLALLPQKEG
jgi:hypothetical protein